MVKKVVLFAVSICLLLSALGVTVFAAKETDSTLVPGLYSTFLIEGDGSLWGWGQNGGANGYSFLGDGTVTAVAAPKIITYDVKAVIPGYECTFLIKKDNSLWGFGKRIPGLIEPSRTEFQLSPVKIMDNVAAVALSDGLDSPDKIGALVLKTDGTLWAAGYDGTKALPAPKQIMTDVQNVFAGYNNLYAIKKDGSLMAWGDAYDRIGKQAEDKSVPVKIMDDAENCAVGGFATYVAKKDGTIWGFGYNIFGMLGEAVMSDLSGLSVDAEDGGYQSLLSSVQLVSEPVLLAEEASPQIGELAFTLYFMKPDNSLWTIGGKMTYDSMTDETKYTRTTNQILGDVDYFNVGLNSHMFVVQKDGSAWFVDTTDNRLAQSGDGTADRKFNPFSIANAFEREEISETVMKALGELSYDEPLATSRENFLRYTEQGIASYARVSAKAVDKSTVDKQKTKAEAMKETLENQIELSGYEYFRTLETGVTIFMSQQSTVKIASSAAEANVDNINIVARGFGLVVEPKKIGRDLSGGLDVTVTSDEPGKFNVKLNKSLNSPLKIQVPPGDGMPYIYQYVTDAKGEPVPSFYNSTNGKLEFKVVSSGEYTIGKNRTNFGDLGDDPALALSVNYLASKDIMPGTGKSTFSPNKTITRAEAVALITKAFLSYDDSINGLFGQGSALRKDEAAALCESVLLNEFNYLPLENVSVYIDDYSDAASIEEWSKEYVAMAVRDGLFGMYQDEAFNPGKQLTRGEFAKILYRLYKLSW